MLLQSKCQLILAYIIVNNFTTYKSDAQLVYSTNYASDAQVKVYVTKYKSDADLLVYKTKYKNDAQGNNGIWYFTEYANDAKKRIFFTDYKTDADLVIFMAKNKIDAGWVKKNKKHLMY